MECTHVLQGHTHPSLPLGVCLCIGGGGGSHGTASRAGGQTARRAARTGCRSPPPGCPGLRPWPPCRCGCADDLQAGGGGVRDVLGCAPPWLRAAGAVPGVLQHCHTPCPALLPSPPPPPLRALPPSSTCGVALHALRVLHLDHCVRPRGHGGTCVRWCGMGRAAGWAWRGAAAGQGTWCSCTRPQNPGRPAQDPPVVM